jgi:hypothetical protein
MTSMDPAPKQGPFSVGQRVGNYTIERFVAAAGQGAVYQALHEGLGRRAAIKALAGPRGVDAGTLARFEREARSLARLDRHPEIVKVFDFGVEQTVPYLVMEWVEGEDLHQRIRRGPVPIEEALQIFIQILRGLAAAHAAGITHRDIKPHNLLLSGDGRAMVADFGVVRVAESDLTSEGHVPGTFAYMAPEQIGDGTTSPASDMYSVACSLFEALTARKPFAETGHPSRLMRPFPSVRAHRPDCPPDVDALLQRLGSQDPVARPSAAAAAKELERLVASSADGWLTERLPLPIARARRDARMRARSPVAVAAARDYVDAICRTAALGLLSCLPADRAAAALEPLLTDAGLRGWIGVLDRTLAAAAASVLPPHLADVARFASSSVIGPRVRALRALLGAAGAPVTFLALAAELAAALRSDRIGGDPADLCEATILALDEALLGAPSIANLGLVARDHERAWELHGDCPHPGPAHDPGQLVGVFLRGATTAAPLSPLAAFEDGDWYWFSGFETRGGVFRCTTSGHSYVSADVGDVRQLLPSGAQVTEEPLVELPTLQLDEDVERLPEALRALLYEAASCAVRDPRRSHLLSSQAAEWTLSRAFGLPSVKLLDACARLRQSTGYPKLVECMAELVLRAPENGLLGARSAELAVFGALWLALWRAGSAGLLVTFGPTEALRALGGAPPLLAANASTFKRGTRAAAATGRGLDHLREAPALALHCLGPRLLVGRRDVALRRHPSRGDCHVVTLGREADNDVVIPSPFVSRRHAVIERGPAGLVLAQDQPTNGSAVNGCKLDVGERHPLRAGDLFFLETEAFLLLEA